MRLIHKPILNVHIRPEGDVILMTPMIGIPLIQALRGSFGVVD